ncbi:MAG: HK97 family phage prohead protease [Ruminococcus sp.]|nr:HK97 family phage prohead protease [Ruminococcus sp.]MCM1380347.1 HK97 family phage prohead protease [Muribaculaceae bacterium]MCM1478343.1 HK97 family phage prohead protease [Muribaculaceae bacterium]
MKIEIRNDRVIIDGYVNAVGRDSRPIMPKSALFPDKCVEQVVPGVFKKSLENRSEVDLLINHDRNRRIGSTKSGELSLKEDSIGLRAHAVITDPGAIEKARNGEFTGWSFGMYVGGEEREERAGDIPRRRLTDIDLFEVSLIDRAMQPCYAGTLVECRADGETVSETRSFEDEVKIENNVPVPDFSEYEKRLADLRARCDIADAEGRLAELRYNHNHDP